MRNFEIVVVVVVQVVVRRQMTRVDCKCSVALSNLAAKSALLVPFVAGVRLAHIDTEPVGPAAAVAVAAGIHRARHFEQIASAPFVDDSVDTVGS